MNVQIHPGMPGYEPHGKGRKSWYSRLTTWILRLLLILFVLFIVGIGGLSLITGTGESQRRGLEQAFAQVFGQPVKIGELTELSIYPDLVFTVEDVEFVGPEGETQIRAEKLRLGFYFWHLVFGWGVLKDFDASGVTFAGGTVLPRELHIKQAAIIPPGKAGGGEAPQKGQGDPAQNTGRGPQLKISGAYGGDPLDLEIDVQVYDRSGDKYYYETGERNPVRFSLGRARVEGDLVFPKPGVYGLRGAVIGDPDPIIKGDVTYDLNDGNDHFTMDARLGQSAITADVRFAKVTPRPKLTGNITAQTFYLSDISGKTASLTRLLDLVEDLTSTKDQLQSVEKQEPEIINLKGSDMDVAISVEQFREGEEELGHLNVPLVIEDGRLTVQPFEGVFSGGDLKGDVLLDSSLSPAVLKIDAGLRNWDFGKLQRGMYGYENVSGTADMVVLLEGKGKTYPELSRDLHGRMTFVAGKGEFASTALNVWGGGLLNAMIPGRDPEDQTVLNCAIANFPVKEGVAEAKHLFLDTKRLTVKGSGKINMAKGTIDLTLDPVTKETALIDVATSVGISGSLANPSIGPKTGSVAKKIGGALLGVVNPAFLAFSMTDFGLTENHPCQAFIKSDSGDKIGPEKQEGPDDTKAGKDTGKQGIADEPEQEGSDLQMPSRTAGGGDE